MILTIRAAAPSDVPALARFTEALAVETGGPPSAPDSAAAGISALLADHTRGFCLVAETGGAAVGQLVITYEWSDWRNGAFWWIQNAWVDPSHRRQGILRGLYRHALDLARAEPGVKGLRLRVDDANRPARLCFERLGFENPGYFLYKLDLAHGN